MIIQSTAGELEYDATLCSLFSAHSPGMSDIFFDPQGKAAELRKFGVMDPCSSLLHFPSLVSDNLLTEGFPLPPKRNKEERSSAFSTRMRRPNCHIPIRGKSNGCDLSLLETCARHFNVWPRYLRTLAHDARQLRGQPKSTAVQDKSSPLPVALVSLIHFFPFHHAPPLPCRLDDT